MKEKCNGDHNIFVAEVVGVESEGKVFVLALCRLCDLFNVHEVVVSQPGRQLRLLRQEVV